MEAIAHRSARADPDSDLVVATQRDVAEFEALYDRYFLRVYRYVRMRVNNTQAAEDITSQVFLAALAGISGFRPTGNFAAWLFRIAHNTVLISFRVRPTAPLDMDALATMAEQEPGPESRMLAEETAAALRVRISALQVEQQHLLALRFGADLSTVEIAAILGKSPESVRVSLHRTIKELRQRYNDDH